MKIISVMNHARRAGRTTVTWELGRELAGRGHTVLLADCDPSCDLTGRALGGRTQEPCQGERKQNIRQGVKAVFDGRLTPVMPLQQCPVPGGPDGLYLIPGHPNLSGFELKLRSALDEYEPYSMAQNIPGSFYELFRLCAEDTRADVVLLDTGAGVSALNQIFFSICDAFLIPFHMDEPSVRSELKTAKKTVRRWRRDMRSYRHIFYATSYPLPEGNAMDFLGYAVFLDSRSEADARGLLAECGEKILQGTPFFIPPPSDTENVRTPDEPYSPVAAAVETLLLRGDEG